MNVEADRAEFPVGRHLAVDERGVGLRATWRLDRGFVNLSLWRDNACVETFHLTPAAAAELIGFLVRGLASVTALARMSSVSTLEPLLPKTDRRLAAALTAKARALRTSIADHLLTAASRIGQS